MFPRPLCAFTSQTMWCAKKEKKQTTKSQTGGRGREKQGYTIRYETRGVLPSSWGACCSIPICPARVCGGEDVHHRELAGGTLREWRACSRFLWIMKWVFLMWRTGEKHCESMASTLQSRERKREYPHTCRHTWSLCQNKTNPENNLLLRLSSIYNFLPLPLVLAPQNRYTSI